MNQSQSRPSRPLQNIQLRNENSTTGDNKEQPWKALVQPRSINYHEPTFEKHPDIRLQAQKDEHNSMGG